MNTRHVERLLLADVLRVRRELGWSYEALAKHCGVSRSLLCDIDCGRKKMSERIKGKLAYLVYRQIQESSRIGDY